MEIPETVGDRAIVAKILPAENEAEGGFGGHVVVGTMELVVRLAVAGIIVERGSCPAFQFATDCIGEFAAMDDEHLHCVIGDENVEPGGGLLGGARARVMGKFRTV